MSLLPDTNRILLGPGPSLTSPRVMRAMASPTLSHLDPLMLRLLDDVRERLGRVFRAGDGSFAFAVSGTGTSGMETTVANLVKEGTRATVIVTGYFGDRLATMLARYGATVERLDAEWGRAIDPALVRKALGSARYDLVSIVHAETSTGVLNPLQDVAREAAAHDALVIADTVTSLGALPLDMRAWHVDVCYSCSQKGLGAPSGLSPLALSPRALERRVASRSFAFDVALLEDFWVRRKYHHTISAPLVYALATALEEVEEDGLEARWARHERVHRQLVDRLAPLGLGLLPPAAERLWNLNAVAVPDGVNEAAVRRCLLSKEGIEIGAGLGPLAGRVWRIGLMGSGATPQNVDRLVSALPQALDAGRQ